MTTLTFLGLTGGSGTTALVALTLLTHPGSTSTLPELTSFDPATLERRIGHPFPSVIGDRHIADAGRYSVPKLHTALQDGHAVLVAPLGARGDRAVAHATDGLELPHRRILGPHVTTARVGVNGRTRTTPLDAETAVLPYDRHLAHGTPLHEIQHRLGRRTHQALARWNQRLEDHLWHTRPLEPGLLAELQRSPSHPNPWTQPGSDARSS